MAQADEARPFDDDPLVDNLPAVRQRAFELDRFNVISGLRLLGGVDIDILTGTSLHGGLTAAWPTTGVSARALGDRRGTRLASPTRCVADASTRLPAIQVTAAMTPRGRRQPEPFSDSPHPPEPPKSRCTQDAPGLRPPHVEHPVRCVDRDRPDPRPPRHGSPRQGAGAGAHVDEDRTGSSDNDLVDEVKKPERGRRDDGRPPALVAGGDPVVRSAVSDCGGAATNGSSGYRFKTLSNSAGRHRPQRRRHSFSAPSMYRKPRAGP